MDEELGGHYYQVRSGDNWSKILGTSNAQTLGTALYLNDRTNSTLHPGDNVFIADNPNAYGDRSKLGQRALNTDNASLERAQTKAWLEKSDQEDIAAALFEQSQASYRENREAMTNQSAMKMNPNARQMPSISYSEFVDGVRGVANQFADALHVPLAETISSLDPYGLLNVNPMGGMSLTAGIQVLDGALNLPSTYFRIPEMAYQGGSQIGQAAYDPNIHGYDAFLKGAEGATNLLNAFNTGVSPIFLMGPAEVAPTLATNAAARSEAASNIWQARKILAETRTDLTIVDRNQIIKGFDLETFRVRTLDTTLTEFRYFDDLPGGAGMNGRWSTSQWFDTPADRITNLALPNNQATFGATVNLQPGTTVFQGTVAPQLRFGPNLTGGAAQTYNAFGPRAVITRLP